MGYKSICIEMNQQYQEGLTLARQWVKGVDIGGIDLEMFLFEEEIQQEKLDIALKAAEKIKKAVEEMNKKVTDDKLMNGKEGGVRNKEKVTPIEKNKDIDPE